MKRINSKDKGGRGERALRDLFREQGYEARRGRQYCGSPDSPDVVIEAPNLPIHVECKCVERINIHDALYQAEKDCGDKLPTVWFKRNRDPWNVVMRAGHFFELLRRQ